MVNADGSGDGVDRSAVAKSSQLMLDRACGSVAASARADGIAVALMSVSGARELVYASTALAQYLDDIQFTSGVGPCLDAFTSEQPILCSDLRAPEFRERWLGFVDDAIAAGAASVFAFPLVSGSTVFGSLELYRTSTGDLDPAEHTATVRGAATIAHVVLTYFAAEAEANSAEPADRRHNEVLNSEFSRPQVNHAAGMVSVQLNASIEDAMATMRSRAYLEHRSLTDIADDVVARRLSFDAKDSEAERDEGGGS